MWHFSFRETAPNLHVSPKTDLPASKNAGFVFAVEICYFSVFTYNFYSCNKYIFVKFCTETIKNARRKLLNFGNKHSVFVPNTAIFILERNLIGQILITC